jgi:hypothetical protein
LKFEIAFDLHVKELIFNLCYLNQRHLNKCPLEPTVFVYHARTLLVDNTAGLTINGYFSCLKKRIVYYRTRTLKMLRATHLRRAYVTIPVEMACHLKASH